MTHFHIVPGRDTAELDNEIARLYSIGHPPKEIAKRIGLARGSINNRLTKMFRAGILLPRGR